MAATLGELRVMDIPPNRKGLGEGTWLRWEELSRALVEAGYDDLVVEIVAAILTDPAGDLRPPNLITI